MSNRFVHFIKSVFGVNVFIRNIHAETLLENFFVAAVVALLGTRLFLKLTGYPTIGGESLHIAHMLFGGLLMLVALFILLSTLNHAAEEMGAIAGGAGFGVFIDDLGKFITNDNDYFFQPTITLIYIVFVVLYMTIRLINRSRVLSPEEALVNAFEIAKQASLSNLDARDHYLILRLLDRADPDDPFTRNLKDMLPRISMVPARNDHLVTRLKHIFDKVYLKIADTWWFSNAVTGFFVLSSGITFYNIIALIDWSWLLLLWITAGIGVLILLFSQFKNRSTFLEVIASVGVLAVAVFIAFIVLDNLKATTASAIDFARFFSSSISAVLVVLVILRIYRFRLGAYYMFRRATMVSILLTRVFSFYEVQFAALAGLAGDILILVALRYMIRQEEIRLGRLSETK